jgi:hypothetical protein
MEEKKGKRKGKEKGKNSNRVQSLKKKSSCQYGKIFRKRK